MSLLDNTITSMTSITPTKQQIAKIEAIREQYKELTKFIFVNMDKENRLPLGYFMDFISMCDHIVKSIAKVRSSREKLISLRYLDSFRSINIDHKFKNVEDLETSLMWIVKGIILEGRSFTNEPD